LVDKLKAEKFAEIDPLNFFDFDGIYIKESVVETLKFPKSEFYAWQSEDGKGDIVIFVSEAQPSSNSYEFAQIVLDVTEKLGAKKVYTAAAAVTTKLPKKPRIWGVATNPDLLEELKKNDIALPGDIQIDGMNGNLLSIAVERGFEGICLLGETPHYVAKRRNLSASLEILRALSKMLNVKIDLKEMEELARQNKKELEKRTTEMKTEFIERFTKPIWERGGEGNEQF
jgi:hypothetical protein